MSYKSCAFTTFDKITSIRVFLHPGTAESCSLMLNRIKINSHLLPINILRVFDISQDFYHSALKFFQWTFSLVKETLSTIYLQTAFSIPSSGFFFKHKDQNPFWNQCTASSHLPQKRELQFQVWKPRKSHLCPTYNPTTKPRAWWHSQIPPAQATGSYLLGTAVLMPGLKMVITNGVFQGQTTYVSKAAEYFLASSKPLFKNNL